MASRHAEDGSQVRLKAGSRWGPGGVVNKVGSTKSTRSLTQNGPRLICPASGHIADLVPSAAQQQHGGQGGGMGGCQQGGVNKVGSAKSIRSLTQNDPSFICPTPGHIADLVPSATQYQHG